MDCQASFQTPSGGSQWAAQGAGRINWDGMLFKGGGTGSATQGGTTTTGGISELFLGPKG